MNRDREEAAALLPPPDDMWATDADWNRYYHYREGGYWRELKHTAEQLGALLRHPMFKNWDLYYWAG